MKKRAESLCGGVHSLEYGDSWMNHFILLKIFSATDLLPHLFVFNQECKCLDFQIRHFLSNEMLSQILWWDKVGGREEETSYGNQRACGLYCAARFIGWTVIQFSMFNHFPVCVGCVYVDLAGPCLHLSVTVLKRNDQSLKKRCTIVNSFPWTPYSHLAVWYTCLTVLHP